MEKECLLYTSVAISIRDGAFKHIIEVFFLNLFVYCTHSSTLHTLLGSLNENDPRKFKCLKTCSPVSGTFCKGD